MVPQQPNGDEETESEANAGGEEGAGPRFKKGSEDLDQLEGVEKHQQRSRRARRDNEQDDPEKDPDPDESYPLIDAIEKSKRRLKNRFKGIKKPEDAIDEFGS